MANEFDNFDLQQELDNEAFDIINQGNTNLAFGGSSEQEAQIFGQQINASDAPKVGAFLGGVALANLKVQNERAERFARVRSLQEEILKREGQVIDREGIATTRRGQDISADTSRRGQDLGLQQTMIRDDTSRRGQDLGLRETTLRDATSRRGQDISRQNTLDTLRIRDQELRQRIAETPDLQEKNRLELQKRRVDLAASLKNLNDASRGEVTQEQYNQALIYIRDRNRGLGIEDEETKSLINTLRNANSPEQKKRVIDSIILDATRREF